MAIFRAPERRAEIALLLREASGPVSAAALAGRFSVSRQIIVGDIALLRASGTPIIATPRGYTLLPQPDRGITQITACVHGPQDIGRELRAIVDAGGEVEDVMVEHPVYGQLTGALHIRSRYDVDAFLRRIQEQDAQPLSLLTSGVHLHTIRCPDTATLEHVLAALECEGVLYR